MKYNPDIHHRRSIRLKGYDYSQAGAYYVTTCIQGRECLFGYIKGGKILLNDAGRMVEKWWIELVNKFRDIELDEFIIMPNHIHGIIINVGADLRVCPDNNNDTHTNNGDTDKGEHTGSPLHRIIQWFKTMTSNEYIMAAKQYDWLRFNGKLWQRNYYEHSIRNETELNKIREYIINNPVNWELDENFKD